jgi:hypothetical protein
MAASLKDKRTPITKPPYQVPSVDVTPDPPIFSLVTTFKPFIGVICKLVSLEDDVSFASLDKQSTVSHAEVQKNFLMLPSTSVDLCSHNYLYDDVSVFILLLLLLE